MSEHEIKTIIIDDEQLARTRIRNLLIEHPQFKLAGEASNGNDALKLINVHNPDCIFLDISLPGIDGFSIIEQNKTTKEPIVIVVSGSEDHALKAFEYYAFDYLLKPYKDKRFEKTIQKVIDQFRRNNGASKSNLNRNDEEDQIPKSTNRLIPIKNAGKIQFIETAEIHFVEASGYYIEINLAEKKYLLRQSMGRIIKKLDSDKFIRIHRSAIINLQFMQEITRTINKEYGIKMKNGRTFKVSKSYKKELFEKLNL